VRAAYLLPGSLLLLAMVISCEVSPPKEAPFSEKALSTASARVDSLMESVVAPDGPGAAVGVVWQGAFIHKKGYGLADLDKKIPFTAETPCYLASVSKQFTCMAAMILQEEGKLSYTGRLRKYFPEAPEEWDSIMVRHLMTHTSGLTEFFNLGWDEEDITNRKVLKKLIEHKALDFAPGEKYSYSNSGYISLALAIEEAGGEPFSVFVGEKIFGTLGMKSSLVYDESKPVIPSRARGYKKDENGYLLDDYNILTQGAGGMFSTVEDLYKWDQGLYTEKLVSAGTLQEAWTPQVRKDEGGGYGYGWAIEDFRGMKRVAHGGSMRGFKTHLARLPEQEFTVIILTNGQWYEPGRIVDEILGFYFPGE
jgi:CubicO group peptidase (beta-lactamase class C family)